MEGYIAMDQKKIIERLKNDPNLMQKLAQSPDAQALMRLLQTDGGKSLEQAAAGNTAQLLSAMKQIMSTPGGAALLQRIGNSLQE